MSPVVYRGTRAADGQTPQVLKCVDDLAPVPLPLYDHVRRHSDAHNWGYHGSGPRQLATALLADVLGEGYARDLANALKVEVICKLPWEGFAISAEQIEQWALSFDPPPPPEST